MESTAARTAVVILAVCFACAGPTSHEQPASVEPTSGEYGPSFEWASPEEAGYSPDKLEAIEAYLEEIGSAAFLMLDGDKVVMSWGEVETEYPIHSIRKALVSALYGILVDRGVIDLDATLAELGIDDIPPALTEAEKQATVRDLLASRSGVYHEAAAEAAEMIADRPARGSQPPGEHFYYNNWDFNVAGAILEQATGESLYESFDREIARHIGMTGYQPDDGFYMHEKEKSRYPAYHFRMTASDLARFGLLYLGRGSWYGTQIVPEAWIAESTRPRSVLSEELGVGYGLMWYAMLEPDGPDRAFFHTGAGVHMLAVDPALDLVWVHRVDTERPYDMTSQHIIVLWQMIMEARTTAVEAG
jgi:CubicO group peptidase (beta-lactamase class C family)